MNVRELEPADAPALSALYGDYEWWADRAVEDVRRALVENRSLSASTWRVTSWRRRGY